uniref:Uncharacterized protein n=1 Tax=Timema bartmani TaxID=61472 RepID=A0A7R9F9T3_9NEOP|nr:unnamed protein product [Timema bartmani]
MEAPHKRFGTSINLEDLTQSNSCLFISQLEKKRQEVVQIPNEYRDVLLLTTILNHMVTFEESLTEEIFDALKEQESRNYLNNFLKPSKLSRVLVADMLAQDFRRKVGKQSRRIGICRLRNEEERETVFKKGKKLYDQG